MQAIYRYVNKNKHWSNADRINIASNVACPHKFKGICDEQVLIF